MRRISTRDEWDAFVQANNGHPLQRSGWGEVKARHGWRAERYIADSGEWGAQVLIKRLPWPLHSFAYIPRGPVGNWQYSDELDRLARLIKKQHKAVALSVEPHQTDALQLKGWRRTPHTILLPRTIVLDLTRSEDELLSKMAKKTRQYIRKSAASIHVKKIETEQGIKKCLEVYHQTATRAGFSLHGDDYYTDIVSYFDEGTVIYGAFEGETLVAFLWLAVSDTIAFELYGGITDRGQELRANYALKWQTIQDMQQHGIKEYDFNGLLNDGISNFKQSFADHESQLVGTYDKPLSIWYGVWRYGLPLAKKVVRLLKRV